MNKFKRTNWSIAICPKCHRKVKFLPLDNWNGKVRCADCMLVFEVRRLGS